MYSFGMWVCTAQPQPWPHGILPTVLKYMHICCLQMNCAAKRVNCYCMYICTFSFTVFRAGFPKNRETQSMEPQVYCVDSVSRAFDRRKPPLLKFPPYSSCWIHLKCIAVPTEASTCSCDWQLPACAYTAFLASYWHSNMKWCLILG